MQGGNVFKVLVHYIYIQSIADGGKNNEKGITNILHVNLPVSAQNQDQHSGKTQ